MKLRHWQRTCIDEALRKYQLPHSHFLCLASPGAGKTIMAATLAKELFDNKKIDLVMCFSPSTVIASDFQIELELVTQKRFCGGLASSGTSLCYHSMQNLDKRFWSLLEQNRVFVIFDEIHHCAGGTFHTANTWGGQILANIQGKATYTLALTGTPWRSDNIPIALANYCQSSNNIHCDHKYGLIDAINDGVCRVPHITALDNRKITATNRNETSVYSSFSHLFASSIFGYKDIIEHPIVIKHLLIMAKSKLDKLRKLHPDIGGLIVAASVEHANQIKGCLLALGETAINVNYREYEPLLTIGSFKYSKDKWIISVGMISEGTNIPRLQVCCYLSHVKTELYFRQVLGRIMRVYRNTDERGYFFMPAHEKLMEYARRISEDIPEQVKIKTEIINTLELKAPKLNENQSEKTPEIGEKNLKLGTLSSRLSNDTVYDMDSDDDQTLDDSYLSKINSLGRFSQVIFEL
jgi:superfamily II DNA or RNA helicase